MVQATISFQNKETPGRSVSPLLEMGSYELLWSQRGASFKNIAERFRTSCEALPSDLVDHAKALEMAEKVLVLLHRKGISRSGFGVRIHRAGEYPAKLRDAMHPVELLYFRGIWELVETPSIAIVGTRKPSEEGRKEAKALARFMVQNEITIVSGLAEGIDTAAHTTAIDSGGRTIAVIGTPICEVYPRNNTALQERIAREFLLISQVPIFRYYMQQWSLNRLFFPERNATMSALTDATVIVEAGNTSGTLHQARAAIHQRRKLFIMDRCFQNPDLTWPAFYEAKGAIRVRDFHQILEAFPSAAKTL
jgi:DNA processing protein